MAARFEIIAKCPITSARRGRLHTPHGIVETPAFMPVGTQGTVKTLGSEDLEALGYDLILANTYHLALRPGAEAVHRLGGLHKFMSWKGAILTDSGGYQVMSLASRREIAEEGVRFKSHLDGTEIFLSPERSVEIQRLLGVDVMMALDVCPSYPCSRDEAAEAVRLTHLWAERNLKANVAPPPVLEEEGVGGEGVRDNRQLSAVPPASARNAATSQHRSNDSPSLFGIIQGGIYEDLRSESAAYISSLPFDGFAIGGVSVGEPTDMQRPVVEFTAPLLPEDRPRYLMGVGHPGDILHAVSQGIDLFDCVLPTRLARHHSLYTMQGRVNILNAKWAEHDGPVDPESVFPQTQRYSAAYLRHLFNAEEALGQRLATLHNLAFYERLMREVRQAIESGSWGELQDRYARS